MLKRDAIRFYGTAASLARALGIHRSAVLRWPKRLPITRAFQVERLTEGKLKCDVGIYLDRK